jgi:lipid-A-disaccharide synthase
MPATFVGHPLFENDTNARSTADLPAADGRIKLALLPGSREAEVRKNLTDMLDAVDRMRAIHGEVAAIIAAGDEHRADQIRRLLSYRSVGDAEVDVRVGQTDQVLDWADVGVIVSGTATLDAVKHGLPFVTVYRASPWMWHLLGRWLVQINTFTLANLIGEWLGLGRVTPELVPYFGPPARIAEALEPLMSEGPARQAQRRAFEQIRACYAKHPFSRTATDTLLGVLHGTPGHDLHVPSS